VKDIAAIILAAGRSRRMGAFKPLLPFGDGTVIESCIHNIRTAGIEDIIVVTGHRGEELRAHLESHSTTFAQNPNPDSEMSVSIALGIEQVAADKKAVLITPVDHPAVPPEVIKSIVHEWRHAGARLVQPEHQGRGGHPVLIDLAFRNELMHLDPQTGLRSLFDHHRTEVHRLPVTSPFVARDTDTWEDYLDLHLAVFGWKPDLSPAGERLVATNGNPSGLI
jgi:CTP:molybdopterin cytidylyltransferase MocA